MVKTTYSKKPSSSAVLSTCQEIVPHPGHHTGQCCATRCLVGHCRCKEADGGWEHTVGTTPSIIQYPHLSAWCPVGASQETEKGQDQMMVKVKARHPPGSSQCCLPRNRAMPVRTSVRISSVLPEGGIPHPGITVRKRRESSEDPENKTPCLV